ncbi:hypothetical protein PFMALIP_03481 [Plasmodium falciparum MaliPS096_E11]|uniref:Uncharacterized protein n=1 Tax=Plasmodium falciparum MaliPS096_E11 TaxID=1036727 RepID=A0A024WMW3_PLAFA|nr:hypothetical protein PFMALIP_03481 [Plasmodium falciparum MaliPS096_E11]
MSQFRNHLKQYKNTNYKKDNYPLVKISNGIKKKYILNNKRSGNEIYNKAYYSENNTSSELYSNNTSEEKKRNHKDITCGKDLKQSTSHYVDNYNSSKDIKEKRFDKVKTKMNNYVDDNNYIETNDDVDDNKYIHTDTDDDVDDNKYIHTDDDVDDNISLYSNNNKSVYQCTKEDDEGKASYISNRNNYIKLNKKMEGTKDHLYNKRYNSSKISSYSKIKKSNLLNSKLKDNEYTNEIKNNIRYNQNNISNNKIYNDNKSERDKYTERGSREVKYNTSIDNVNYKEKKNKYQSNKKCVNHEAFLSTHEQSKFFNNEIKKNEINDINMKNSRSKSSYKKESYLDNSKDKNSSHESYENNISENVINKMDGFYKSLTPHEIKKNIYCSNISEEEKNNYFPSQSILRCDKTKNTSTQEIDGDTINKIVNHYDEQYIKDKSDLDIRNERNEKDKVYKKCCSLKQNRMIQKHSSLDEQNEDHDKVEIYYKKKENDMDKYIEQEKQKKKQNDNNKMNNNFISSEDVNFKNKSDITQQHNYGDKASTHYNINEDEKKNNDINNMCVNTIYSNDDENLFQEQKKENVYCKKLKDDLIKDNYSLDIQNDKTKQTYTSHNIRSNIYNYQLDRHTYDLQNNSKKDEDISFNKDNNITLLNENDIAFDKDKNIIENKYNKLLYSDIYKTEGNAKKLKQNSLCKIIEEQNKNDQINNYKNCTHNKDSVYDKDEITMEKNNILDKSYYKDIRNEHSNDIYHNNNITCQSLKSENYNINHSNVNHNNNGKYLQGVVGINEANEYLKNQLNVLLKDNNQINKNEKNNVDENNCYNNSMDKSKHSSKEKVYINNNDEIPIKFEKLYTSHIYNEKKGNIMMDENIDKYNDDKNKGSHFKEENFNLYRKKLSDIKNINGKNTTNINNSEEVLLNKDLIKSMDISNPIRVDENNASTYINKNMDNNVSIINTNKNNTIHNNNYELSVDNIKREFNVDKTSIHNVCSLDTIKGENVLKKPILNIISDDENNKNDTVKKGIENTNNINTMNGTKTNNYMVNSFTMPNISNIIHNKHMLYTNRFNEKNKMNIYNSASHQTILGEQGNYNNLFCNPNMVNNENIKRILYNKALTTANIGHTHNNNNNNNINNNNNNNNNNILYNQMNNDQYNINKINTFDYLNKYNNMPMDISTLNKSDYGNLQNDNLNNICILPLNPNIQQHSFNYNMNTGYIPNNNFLYNNKLCYDESGKIFIRGDKPLNNGAIIYNGNKLT